MAQVPVLTLNDGRKFPALGLGTLKSDETVEAIKYAIKEAGYRHIDCAHLYENEKEIGKALKSIFDEGIVKREELWVTSKLWNTYHEHDLAIKALDITLKNLQLDYLDLYLIHWPQGFVYHGDDVLYPRDESGKLIFSEVSPVDTWRTMIELQRSGKVKSIGVSNFSAEQIDQLIAETGVVPAVNQVECHPYLAQKDLLEHHRKHNIVLTAYSPLGAPYKALENYPVLLKNPVVQTIADKYNRSASDILIAYHIQRGSSVIPKSSNEKRMISNIKAASLKLTLDEVQILDNLNKDLRYCRFKEFASFKYFPFNYNN